MSYAREEEDMEEDMMDGVNQTVTDLANATVPTNLKGIRACMRCGVLKTMDQFLDEGCENCPFLSMADDTQQANKCTTAFYEGQVAVMDPRSR